MRKMMKMAYGNEVLAVTAPRGVELNEGGLAAVEHLIEVLGSEINDVAGAGAGQEGREQEEGEKEAGHGVDAGSIQQNQEPATSTAVPSSHRGCQLLAAGVSTHQFPKRFETSSNVIELCAKGLLFYFGVDLAILSLYFPAAHMSDPASYSNVTEVRTASLHIELDVDFERHVLCGYVTIAF
jgi:hypothetical protein